MALTDNSSSPAPGGFSTLQEEIAYYKTQYETLEGELQEFQASSKELEAELEKEAEESEKRERSLKEKVESLNFEVGEWKVRCYRPHSWAALRDVDLRQATDHKVGKIQAIEDGGQQRAKHTPERNHITTRNKPESTIETTRC